jgi:hypothetical protein
MDKSRGLIPKESKFLFYTTAEGKVGIDVKFGDETV